MATTYLMKAKDSRVFTGKRVFWPAEGDPPLLAPDYKGEFAPADVRPFLTDHAIANTFGEGGDQGAFPSDPTPDPGSVFGPGDFYYNTTTNELMAYDGDRAKWLSVSVREIDFGRLGNTLTGAWYESAPGVPFDLNAGWVVPFNATIVGLSATRADAVVGDYEITESDTATAPVVETVALDGSGINVNQDLDVDITGGRIIGIRGTGGTTVDVVGTVTVKLRGQ